MSRDKKNTSIMNQVKKARAVSVLVVLLLSSFFIACNEEETKNESTVIGLSISPWQTPSTIGVNDTLVFEAFTTPNFELDKGVEWKVTGDADVIDLDIETGRVIGVKEGWTILFATSSSGYQDSVYVVVGEVDFIIEEIAVDIETINLVEDNTYQMKAATAPANVDSLGLISWTVEDESVLSVTSAGLVSALAVGNSKVYATARNSNNDEIVAVSEISVLERIGLTALSIEPAVLDLEVGNRVSLAVSYEPSNANDTTWVWTSGNEGIITTDENGLVTAVEEGSTTLSLSNGIITSNTVDVTVSSPVLVTGIEITTSTSVLLKAVGATQQLSAIIIPADASNQLVTWTSNDPNIVSVSSTGLVTAVADGITTIQAESEDGGFTDAVVVQVKTIEVLYNTALSENISTLEASIGGTQTLESNPVTSGINSNSNAIKFIKESNPYSHVRFGLPGILNLEEGVLFKFWVLVEDPGKEVTVNTLSLILRNLGNEGATQLQGDVEIDTSKYGEWVEYEIDFSGATPNDDYQLINFFFAQPDLDDDATGMVYYIDNIRGSFLK